MNRTPIEWCRTYNADGGFEEGFSVNPVRFRPRGTNRLVTMCQKISPGCTHCYAATITRRFWPKDADEDFPGYTALGILAGDFVLDKKALQSVLKRKKPARIFWGDMTDLFGEWVPDSFLDRCFAVCALTPHLTHMFLTKRTERMLKYLNNPTVHWRWWDKACLTDFANHSAPSSHAYRILEDPEHVPNPLPNVWLGTSVESQEYADKRIPLLLQTPAAVRFISAEPLLGSVDIRPYLDAEFVVNARDCEPMTEYTAKLLQKMATAAYRQYGGVLLDWVIVGGESGAGAKPMHPDWARSLRDQCKAAGVPFFFKQWGEWGDWDNTEQNDHQAVAVASIVNDERKWPTHLHNFGEDPENGDWAYRIGKKAAGALLDGKEYREFPQVRA